MKTLAERVTIEQACLDGETIICLPHNIIGGHELVSDTSGIIFNWEKCDYSIKPEPMEFWVNVNRGLTILSVHNDEDSAKNAGYNQFKTIKVREVTDESGD